MILDQLTLENFGLYRGVQEFDLTPVSAGDRHRPIVLFGGINGGGKTTLLDAIQLALYGSRARCSKRNGLAYDEFLRRSVHHGTPAGTRAGVILSFRYALDGRENLYDVRRTWTVEDERVRETLRVARDGEIDNWVTENWPQLVEELFPLDIAQLFFFDAEKIRTLAEDESSSRALEAAIKSLLGLDLVERLIADSTVVQSRLAKRATPDDAVSETDPADRVAELQANVERLVSERSALENDRLRAEEDLRTAEASFASAGGKHWEARESRKQRLGELDRQTQEFSDELRTLASGELPLAMITDLLGAVREQDKKERFAASAHAIAELLGERDSRTLDVLREARVSDKAFDAVRRFLDTDRQTREPNRNVERRHALSDGAHELLKHVLDRSIPELTTRATSLLERASRVEDERDDLERANAATPEEGDIGRLVTELSAAAGRLAALNEQARRQDESLTAARLEFREAERALTRHLAAQADAKFDRDDDRRMLQLVGRTRDAMHDFLRRVTTRKIDRLSALITESFQFLLRKKGLIRRIVINPTTFAITLDDGEGREVSKERLSEGEKQLFAVSILWGLSRAAARPLPAVIDTPMARLDATHRRHLVERYFPHASHQVIIFSTDTEVDRESYRLLQPAIARAYHLNYDEKTKATVGEPGYFWAEVEDGSRDRTAKTA